MHVTATPYKEWQDNNGRYEEYVYYVPHQSQQPSTTDHPIGLWTQE